MTVWHIDSLDKRAGLAFATEFKSEGDGIEAEDIRTYFISPPNFEPELVGDRAIALAASNGSFQEGFYIDESPVPFATLTDIVELVRRFHSGGGGGPDGGEPIDIEPFEPEGGGEGESFTQRLKSEFNEIWGRKPSELVAVGYSCEWKILFQAARYHKDIKCSCLNALKQLLLALLSQRQDDEASISKWCRSAEIWMEYLYRTGMEADFDQFLESIPGLLEHIKHRLLYFSPDSQEFEPLREFLSSDRVSVVKGLILLMTSRRDDQGAFIDDINMWLRFYHFQSLYFYESRGIQNEELFDSVWDMRLPQSTFIGLGIEATSSFGQMVSIIFSSIDWVEGANQNGNQNVYDMMIFFAILLNCDGSKLKTRNTFYYRHRPRYVLGAWDVEEWRDVVNKSMNWLAQQLPKRVFSRQIENLIKDFSKATY